MKLVKFSLLGKNMKDRTDLYEITLILTEGEKVSDIEKIIKEFGEIKKSTDLQVKQFAYPIGKLTSGHYYATEFVADGANISKIAQELKAEKSIIRYLITKALRKGPEPIRTGEWAKKPEAGENKELGIKNKESEAKTESTANEQPVKPTEIAEAKPEAKIEEVKVEVPTNEVVGIPTESVGKPKDEPKAEDKLVTKKPRTSVKRPKADKVSALELDKKLEELVKE